MNNRIDYHNLFFFKNLWFFICLFLSCFCFCFDDMGTSDALTSTKQIILLLLANTCSHLPIHNAQIIHETSFL